MKKVLCFICLFLINPLVSYASDTLQVNGDVLNLKAKSSILVEQSTGKVLYENNSHEKLAPASMTKMMSMLLIIEHIESGALSFDDKVVISEKASSMGGSQILLETGEEMSVKDLFKGVAVASGNDAVVALAEKVSGSVDAFVLKMNEKVKELGLKDTNFKNPHGLDEKDHYSSAYDMAMIGRELVKHEKVLEYTSIYEDYLRKGTDREFWLVNTNKLVKFNPMIDGLKTGFTENAGYCLTATAKKNNMRLIATVMGEESTTIRSNEATSLLDYGFASYKVDSIFTKDTIVDKIKIDKAKNINVEIVPVKDVSVLNDITKKLGKITSSLKINEYSLPLKKGDVIGSLTVKEDNKVIDEVDVTVKEDVNKINFINLYTRYIQDILLGNN